MLPLIMPLGDCALLVRFGEHLTDAVNISAIAFAARAEAASIPGVTEIVPNLASVLLQYDPKAIDFERLAGEVRLLGAGVGQAAKGVRHAVPVAFDGEDLAEVGSLLNMDIDAFIAAHNHRELRVLATGFAPGFLYCGMHPEPLHLARRQVVRRQVAAGTVLFAAGQTAITSTPIPTGWHVIGHTAFRNFDAAAVPPTTVRAGDTIRFELAR